MAQHPFDSPRDRFSAGVERTRRQFLGLMGALGSMGALVFGGFMSLKFLYPNATNEEPAAFKYDVDPTTIKPGDVHSITNKRVTIIRDDGGFYAVQLICTHLGCTPIYRSDVVTGTGTSDQVAANKQRALAAGIRTAESPQANGWACPCHGSRYFIDSTNFYGPAPRPMDWVEISKAPDGKLLVDRSKIVVLRGPGVTTAPTWRLDYATNSVKGQTIP